MEAAPNMGHAVFPTGQAIPTVRRLRTALGTLVAIEATSSSDEAAKAAIGGAFGLLDAIGSRLHPHTEHSDLARIGRAPCGVPVAVHPDTWSLLELAHRLSALTQGAFDPCLPCRPGRLRDVELIPDSAVRCHAPVALDFGGFAKGYAVDQAIACLAGAGCCAGLVNAGGDLRRFGPGVEPVWVRREDGCCDTFGLGEAALAVSDVDCRRRPAEHQGYYNRSGAQLGLMKRRATVVADSAVVADALAKCVLLCEESTALRALEAFGAFELTSPAQSEADASAYLPRGSNA